MTAIKCVSLHRYSNNKSWQRDDKRKRGTDLCNPSELKLDGNFLKRYISRPIDPFENNFSSKIRENVKPHGR